jgi:peptidoglycan DL-endopeptidase CwlO
MKQRSATPVLKRVTTRASLVFFAVLLSVSVPLSMIQNVSADDYDRRIAELQSEIDTYQAEADKLNSKADSLQREVNALNHEKNIIQKRIDLNQAKHDRLTAKIKENKQKIAKNQEVLGEAIAELYISGDITSIEMLASSKSIADYVDQEVYYDSVKDTITSTIESTKELKKKLEAQKKEVVRLMGEQKLARDELARKEQQRAQLVAETRGKEAAYKKLVGKREEQKLAVQREQQAAIEAALRAAGGLVNVLPGDPNKGGYPWEAGCWVDAYAWSHGGPNGDGTDPLGYGCRQCVSYTAWKVGQRTGNFPRYWGNANMWPASARASGYSTGYAPRANSVGVISAGQYGHVVWIEAVNGDGTVTVSQYNYYNAGGPGWGHYSKMRVPAGTYDTYIYF